ncbi:MAG TPA: hypothetical protein VMG60_08610 [Burkholderiaceae bacterium]|nr:hypothetical protein [Burkholderiaceae bacterium]
MKTGHLLVLAAVAVAAGCATEQSFSQLDGYRWSRIALNTYDVIIISVDGEHYVQNGATPIMVPPGQHKIVVQGPPTAGFSKGEQRTLDLTVEPCTRYWLEARKQNAVQQDFEPAVNYEEPIAGCKRG